MFYLHFSVFLLISATNLLTRCRSGQFLFSAVFGFRITGNQIFSELEKETILRSFTPEDSRCPKGSSRGPGGPTPAPGAPQPCWPRLARVWPTWAGSDSATSPIYFPRMENPKYSEKIPERS